jgi:uncharacterized repeat protein (TIGR01451 family)
VSQNVWPDRVKAGSDLIYTISVRNHGPEKATNVLLSDTLPAEMNFISVAPGQGLCSESGGIISCALGSVAVDSRAGITISGTLASTSSGTISHTASVTSSESDPNMADNASTQSIALGGSILVANFMNGNNAFLASRIYLWNPSSSAGSVAVRVFTLGHEGASSLLGTVDLGTLEATSARNIKLAEDILAPLEIPLPYTDNGGNLTLEFTIGAHGVHGTAQVFNHALSLGTYQLQGIPSTSNVNPTVLVANFMNGNNAVFNSRVYLRNPSASAGNVVVRVFTLPNTGGSLQLGTVDLGVLEASAARNIKLAEDILMPLGIPLPYTDDGGNLTVEITIGTSNVLGAGQVFSSDLAFGTYPLQEISSNSGPDPTVLVAPFMNGNSASLDSRVYLWNPSASAGGVTARVFTLGRSGASSLLGTMDLGTLGPTSARNIKLAEDILAPLGISLPYTDDGGNLTLELTIDAPNVRGAGQVFSSDLAFGTYPLQEIPSTSGPNPTVLTASFMNGNNGFVNSRVYLWNPSASVGEVTVRVFTLPVIGGIPQELTDTPLNLGTLGAESARNIKLAEDILARLGTPLPYMSDGGNLTVEITIGASNVQGVAQVFSSDLAFGTYPLQ